MVRKIRNRKIVTATELSLNNSKKFETVGCKVETALRLALNSINESIDKGYKHFKVEHAKDIGCGEFSNKFVIHFRKEDRWKYIEFCILSDGEFYSIKK